MIRKLQLTPASTITVDTANLLGATTTGVVTATINTSETVTELATLSADGGTNKLNTNGAYTIVVGQEMQHLQQRRS